MARENIVILHGQIRAKPQIYINDGGVEIKAMMSIKVLRRPTNSQGFDSKLYFDCPVIVTRNPEMIRAIRDLKESDMVDVRGVISTKDIRKSTVCPNCGHKNHDYGSLVYITPIYICARERALNDMDGIQLLKSRSEISNLVNVIGNVCKEPEYYEDSDNRSYAQYPLAVNRRYHIREDADDIKSDFPWIKTFGKQALEDSKCLHVGSSVYISGALQSRTFSRTTICQECSQSYEWTDAVTEIVPYYIGYLANCDVPKNHDEVEPDGIITTKGPVTIKELQENGENESFE